MNNDITIIILTHKSKKLVLDYIKNLYKKFKIIIVDNSNDVDLKSVLLKSYPGIDIHLIPNNGYSNQINFASKLVYTEYFLISNPDVRGINELNILNFIKAAKKLNNKFSVLGPRFLNADPKSHKQSVDNNSIDDLSGGFSENINRNVEFYKFNLIVLFSILLVFLMLSNKIKIDIVSKSSGR